ncbi:MAG TPA: LPS export ABC transporter periplasmic protein LptC [Gammaproteobacteria bacterium]|nr:LPS export ABC transporter periplasmic protein LptC [Gammaproteobacteria bacterium]
MPVRTVTIALVLALAAVLTGWLYSELTSHSVSSGTDRRHVADYYVTDFTATSMDRRGRPERRLSAERLVHYADDDTSRLTRPHLEIFTRDTPPWHISARTGWVSAGGSVVRLSGDVQIHRAGAGGVRAVNGHTTELTVHPDRRYAETDREITLTSPGIRVKSVGMRANMEADRVELLSTVRGTYETNTH